MKCRIIEQECPHSQCLGLNDDQACHIIKQRIDWVNLTPEERTRINRGEYPSLARQAYNLVESTFKVIGNAMKGNPSFVDEETGRSRLDICLNCPGGYFDSEQMRCRDCGCWMENKINLSAMSCPQNYWGSVT